MEDLKNIFILFFNWLMDTQVDLGVVSFSLGGFLIAFWIFSTAIGIIINYFFGGNN